MKHKNWWSLFCSINAGSSGCYVSYDSTESGMDDDHKDFVLVSDCQSQEKKVIKKELYIQLGKDAKFILSLIYDAPLELLSAQGVTQQSIWDYLLTKRWKRKRIKLAFSELKEFVRAT